MLAFLFWFLFQTVCSYGLLASGQKLSRPSIRYCICINEGCTNVCLFIFIVCRISVSRNNGKRKMMSNEWKYNSMLSIVIHQWCRFVDNGNDHDIGICHLPERPFTIHQLISAQTSFHFHRWQTCIIWHFSMKWIETISIDDLWHSGTWRIAQKFIVYMADILCQ